MPIEKNRPDISLWLAEQRIIEGGSAIYTILDKNTGIYYEFNAFDDVWRKSPGDKSSDIINLKNLNNSYLSLDEQKDIRLALAKVLSSGKQIDNQYSVIHTLKLSSLKSTNLENIYSSASRSHKLSLKQLIKSLSLHSPSKYKSLRDKFDLKKIKQSKSLAWDTRRGALSNYEMSEIHIEINEWVNTIFDLDKFNKWKSEYGKGAGKITHIGRLNQFIASRLAVIYSIRPEQINLIKWFNFTNFGGSINEPFLFEGECFFTPYMVKQLDDEPTRPEADPRPVDVNLSKELKIFFDFYIFYLKQSFSNSQIDITDVEIFDLIKDLPLLINEKLIEAIRESTSKEDVLNTIKTKTWLLGRNQCRVFIDNFFQNLNSDSDRVSQSEYKITSKRFRHYTGTQLSLAGESAEVIASTLTQSSIDAAKRYYIHIPPDVQAEIDNKRVDSSFLVQAASGKFVNALRSRISNAVNENEITITQLESGDLGKSASLPACQGCTKTKPMSCYGCINFRPLSTGNHRHYLTIAKKEYEEKRNAGFTGLHLAMYEHQIKKIEITAYYCDLALKAIENNKGD
jgi:hypothetical protein